MNAALIVFLAYMVGVFVLAWAAGRLLRKREFLSEYFLGGRTLGVWAFALTFAATSASGGTFTGFPAKIYTHGWVLALWIASYMVVPLCQMGLLGKRINQVARKSDAITVPDVFRDRFESRALGLVSTLLIVFFLAFNLIAQFKAGSLILKTLLAGVEPYETHAEWLAARLPPWPMFLDTSGHPVDSEYLLCLLTFGLTVVLYTTYGGFHAVVWTDVMQGLIMFLGVLVMLPMALVQVGGLEKATQTLLREPTADVFRVTVEPSRSSRDMGHIPADSYLIWQDRLTDQRYIFRTVSATPVGQSPENVFLNAEMLPLTESNRRDWQPPNGTEFLTDSLKGMGPKQPRSYATAPGPSASDADGFLPVSLAISFFFMWAISGAGQPQYMVRLMAFKNARTLRYAIITVTVYYSLIYIPLVLIFVCARVLLPGVENADQIMPMMAVFLTKGAGVNWLAGLLIAAPFAAVMSTVDSYLLVVSSSLVRDIYQRNLSPDASERTMRWLSYLATLLVGGIAMAGAINPPRFLQDIIVYTGSGLAACFLFPMVAALYWPRANLAGCLSGMLGGFGIHLALHIAGRFTNGEFVQPYLLFGYSPVVIGLLTSLCCVVLVTGLTPPPPEQLVRRYFYQ